MNPVFLNIAIALVTVIASSYSTVKLLQYRAERSEKAERENKLEYAESLKDLRNFIAGINITMERQLIIQKMTTDTLAHLNNKIEQTDKTVVEHTIEIAILKGREKAKNGRT